MVGSAARFPSEKTVCTVFEPRRKGCTMPILTAEKLPKYRKHRGSGQAVVTLNGTDH
jgi:hypothetical protein